MICSQVKSAVVQRSIYIISMILLSSCGGQETNKLEFELSPQSTLRQISALDGNTLKVGVSVNSGPHQTFTLASVEGVSLDITGVNIDEQNDIEIVWYEILNGFDVEISTQQQQFVAGGNTNIDATHQHTLFDYDGDGISNFDERIAGTCVWSAEPDCTIDVPPSATVETDTINIFPDQDGINVLKNPDFTQGRTGWTSNAFDLTTFNEEYCLSSRDESILPENASLNTAQGLFLLEPGERYTFAADVRADNPATPTMRIQEGPPLFFSVHHSNVEVGTTYRPVSTSFIAQDTHSVNVAIWFGDGRSNRFCIDNVVFVKGSL